jgi:hypothetical protein
VAEYMLLPVRPGLNAPEKALRMNIDAFAASRATASLLQCAYTARFLATWRPRGPQASTSEGNGSLASSLPSTATARSFA